MVIKRALKKLPEILDRSGFPEENFDGGLVGVFSLALTQVLHNLGIKDPLSCFQFQRPFRRRGWKGSDLPSPKYFRSDLSVDFSQLSSLNVRRLGKGQPVQNWIEVLLFHPTTNAYQNTPILLRDLLRLLVLVPCEPGADSSPQISTGRFLLHVYQHGPGVKELKYRNYVSLERQVHGQNRQIREWFSTDVDTLSIRVSAVANTNTACFFAGPSTFDNSSSG